MATSDLNSRLRECIVNFVSLEFTRVSNALSGEQLRDFEDSVKYFKSRLEAIVDIIDALDDKTSRELSSAIRKYTDDFINIQITVAGTISIEERRRLSNSADTLDKVLATNYQTLEIELLKFKLDQFSSSDIETKKQRIEEIAREIQNETERTKSSNEALNKSIEEINSKVNVLVPQLAFLDQANLFDKQATNYRESSKLWFLSSLAITLILIGLIGYFVLYFHADQHFISVNLGALVSIKNKLNNQPEFHWLLVFLLVKNLIYRAILLSVLFYFLFFSIKNYFGAKHNLTINAQKSNSLKVIFFLYEKSDTTQKSEILKMALPIIISHQPSGFNKRDQGSILNFGGVKEIIFGPNGQG